MWNLYKLGWIVAFWTAGLSACTLPCSAQGTSSSQESAAKSPDGRSRVQSHDSVTVTATYTPEEKEDWKINEVYQPIYWLEQKGDCETAIERYKTEVIPLAEQSKFEGPKKKFLSLANEGIGGCYMTQRRLCRSRGEVSTKYRLPASGRFELSNQFPRNWESTDGSAALGRCGGIAQEVRVSLLAYLAVVYLREVRTVEALKTVDLAYDEATRPNVPSTFATEIVKVGSMIAQAAGDEDARAKWSQRKPPEK